MGAAYVVSVVACLTGLRFWGMGSFEYFVDAIWIKSYIIYFTALCTIYSLLENCDAIY